METCDIFINKRDGETYEILACRRNCLTLRDSNGKTITQHLTVDPPVFAVSRNVNTTNFVNINTDDFMLETDVYKIIKDVFRYGLHLKVDKSDISYIKADIRNNEDSPRMSLGATLEYHCVNKPALPEIYAKKDWLHLAKENIVEEKARNEAENKLNKMLLARLEPYKEYYIFEKKVYEREGALCMRIIFFSKNGNDKLGVDIKTF
jgi:hypothetical protein